MLFFRPLAVLKTTLQGLPFKVIKSYLFPSPVSKWRAGFRVQIQPLRCQKVATSATIPARRDVGIIVGLQLFNNG
jgi:hypothetical protein